MHWRWLFNGYADPQARLTPEQRSTVRALVDHRLRGRLLAVSVVYVVFPGLVGLGLARFADDWVAAKLGWSLNAAHFALIGTVVFLIWPWSAWVYGCVYARPYRAAMRTVGVRVCTRCGYPLDTLPPGVPCPECGAADNPDAA